jgi:hypothetical protein
MPQQNSALYRYKIAEKLYLIYSGLSLSQMNWCIGNALALISIDT